MASFISSVNGVGLATIDYGSGSPQEAAAFLAYLKRPVGNTTPIGNGQEWNDSTNTWQTVNWQTAGYWASLRARGSAGPGRRPQLPAPQPPGALQHPVLGGRQRGVRKLGDRPPHGAARPGHLHRVRQAVRNLAATIDPTISIGLDVQSPGTDFNNWIAQHPAAVGEPGVHARVPERPQLRASPGKRERFEPLARHGHRHQQRSLGSRQPV